ncbi:hypothetical protein [uncultured Tateyamaria sp.]|uniref:hypothetical protein n=1 Tax=uncultured Tateyamaria sp. TaxID=455651 RepID=UPI00261F2A15|nr:hypothetical protein [uncultured Tateyamaria sp.]
MRLRTVSLFVALIALTACGAVRDSRVNPFNWFGQSRSQPVQRSEEPKEVNPLIPVDRGPGLFASLRRGNEEYFGTPIDQVSELVIERVPGGAIVRATAIADVDNVYDVRLIPANDDLEPDEDGVLVYQVEGVHPEDRRRTTTQRQRTFVVADRITDRKLADIRSIRVEGGRNAQSSARR